MTKSQEKMIACLKEMRTDFSKNGYINKPWDYATAHHTNRAIQTFLVKLNPIKTITKTIIDLNKSTEAKYFIFWNPWNALIQKKTKGLKIRYTANNLTRTTACW